MQLMFFILIAECKEWRGTSLIWVKLKKGIVVIMMGWGRNQVTAFLHPPAQGQGDLLVWALRSGTRHESCSGALSAQSSALKPGKIIGVNNVYAHTPNPNYVENSRKQTGFQHVIFV